MDYFIVFLLVVLSGLFSGLTLGLLSLDKHELKIKGQLGDKRAQKIYAVRKNGNLLLCTLLLSNVAVNATIAIFLGNIVSGVIAGLAATGLILIFGEIIPQASFARYALELGSRAVWLVKIIIIIFLPVCWPLAWALNKFLGEEMPTIYSKKELIKIVEAHKYSKISEIDADEERIIRGALSYSDKLVKQVMTPKKDVFILSESVVLSEKIIKLIKDKGYTRVPVYRKGSRHIVGILYVKDLIGLYDGIKIGKLCQERRSIYVHEDLKLDLLLNKFIKNKIHIAIVEDDKRNFTGIVTLEDVIEEVIKTEIIDETDRS